MENYKNLGRDSGISAYEIGDDYIKVQFKDGAVYRYTNASAGTHHIEKMKRLAKSGRGLNSYVMRNVKHDYASKR